MFYFTPLIGVLFTFPSRYCFSIGHTGIFSLTSWSRQIHTGFHVPHATRDAVKLVPFSTTGLSPSPVRFSAASSKFASLLLLSHDPKFRRTWFRLFPFRSPLLGESLLLSFPLATKMFQFTRFARSTLWIQVVVFRVAPFGYLRINACFPLPEAFRR